MRALGSWVLGPLFIPTLYFHVLKHVGGSKVSKSVTNLNLFTNVLVGCFYKLRITISRCLNYNTVLHNTVLLADSEEQFNLT